MEALDEQLATLAMSANKMMEKVTAHCEDLKYDEASKCFLQFTTLRESLAIFDKDNRVCQKPLVDALCNCIKVFLDSAKPILGCAIVAEDKFQYQVESRTWKQCSFQRIVGCQAAKQSLYENVLIPFALRGSQSSVFSGIRESSNNILLHGPPGTGKTLLAQACANEARASFFEVKPSDVLNKYQGESERYLRGVFESARSSPLGRAIIFFDEFDSIAVSRGVALSDATQSRKLLSELLLQLTENKHLQKGCEVVSDNKQKCGDKRKLPPLSSNCLVVVIAATNRLRDLDEAVLRRFASKIYVGVPEQEGRMQLVMDNLVDVEHSITAADCEAIASMTVGWSGSDIEALTREAAMTPMRELLPQALGMSSQEIIDLFSKGRRPRPISRADFETAHLELLSQMAGAEEEGDEVGEQSALEEL